MPSGGTGDTPTPQKKLGRGKSIGGVRVDKVFDCSFEFISSTRLSPPTSPYRHHQLGLAFSGPHAFQLGGRVLSTFPLDLVTLSGEGTALSSCTLETPASCLPLPLVTCHISPRCTTSSWPPLLSAPAHSTPLANKRL